jgi:hypothetical protein
MVTASLDSGAKDRSGNGFLKTDMKRPPASPRAWIAPHTQATRMTKSHGLHSDGNLK